MITDKQRQHLKRVAESRKKRLETNSHMTYRTKEQMGELIDIAYDKFKDNPVEMTYTEIANETGLHRKTVEAMSDKALIKVAPLLEKFC